MARHRRNGLRRNKFESSQTRQGVELSGQSGTGVPFESVGDHPAWKLATRHVILRRWGSHSAIIVIGSENIHAGTGSSGAGLFLKATAVRWKPGSSLHEGSNVKWSAASFSPIVSGDISIRDWVQGCLSRSYGLHEGSNVKWSAASFSPIVSGDISIRDWVQGCLSRSYGLHEGSNVKWSAASFSPIVSGDISIRDWVQGCLSRSYGLHEGSNVKWSPIVSGDISIRDWVQGCLSRSYGLHEG